MDKKIIAILCAVVAVIVVALLILFGMKHEVSFDSMGGSEVKTQTIKMFGKVEEPEDPTREGYTFDAWYYEDEVFDFDTSVTKDMELVARWIGEEETDNEGNFTVSFNSNGGSSVSAIKVAANGTITKPGNPTRSGYKFVSWQYNGKDWDFSDEVTKNMTLVAKWEKVEDTDSDDDDDQEPTETVAVTGISLSASTLSLEAGKSSKVTATVTPSNATNKSVTWKSSNTSVATVKGGTITGVGAGTATITATVGGKSATVTVTVTAAPEAPADISGYSVVWVPVANSSMGQETLYIKAPNGSYVAGKVNLTVNGKTETVSIPAAGKMYIRSAVAGATVASID